MGGVSHSVCRAKKKRSVCKRGEFVGNHGEAAALRSSRGLCWKCSVSSFEAFEKDCEEKCLALWNEW